MSSLILWDVDGTLMDFKRSEHESLKEALKAFGYNASEADISLYSAINDSCWKRYEKGEMTYDDIFYNRFAEFFSKIGFSADISKVNEIYRKNLGEIFFLNEHALDICLSLKGKIRQYIVTNGYAKTQEKKITASGLADAVDGIFVSGLIGYPKPEKKFFDICFEKIGEVDIKKTIIVGDSLSSDMKGGENAGILTCWYNPLRQKNKGKVKIDFEISRLDEIYEVLDKAGLK